MVPAGNRIFAERDNERLSAFRRLQYETETQKSLSG
jgi:hypothetical protein